MFDILTSLGSSPLSTQVEDFIVLPLVPALNCLKFNISGVLSRLLYKENIPRIAGVLRFLMQQCVIYFYLGLRLKIIFILIMSEHCCHEKQVFILKGDIKFINECSSVIIITTLLNEFLNISSVSS